MVCFSLLTSDSQHLLTYLVVICVPSLGICLLKPFVHCSGRGLGDRHPRICLYSESQSFIRRMSWNIFSHGGFLFALLVVSFDGPRFCSSPTYLFLLLMLKLLSVVSVPLLKDLFFSFHVTPTGTHRPRPCSHIQTHTPPAAAPRPPSC